MSYTIITAVQGDKKVWGIQIQDDADTPAIISLVGRTYTAKIKTIIKQGITEDYGHTVGEFEIENFAPTLGTFDLVLPSAVSRALPVIGTETVFAWDLQYVEGSPEEPITEIRGRLKIYKDITV